MRDLEKQKQAIIRQAIEQQVAQAAKSPQVVKLLVCEHFKGQKSVAH
jgi:hypothetical protein